MPVLHYGHYVSLIPTLHPPHILQAQPKDPGSIKELVRSKLQKPSWYVKFARGAKPIMPWGENK